VTVTVIPSAATGIWASEAVAKNSMHAPKTTIAEVRADKAFIVLATLLLVGLRRGCLNVAGA